MPVGVPVFYFPVKILFLDDDQSLLKHLKNVFKSDYEVLTATDYEDANKILLENTAKNNFNFFVDQTEERYDLCNDISTNLTFSLDFNKIINFIDNKDSASIGIGVLVVDYKMPTINGVDYCKSLTNYRLKKILLTAEAEYEDGIRAFNQHLIDGYIKKGEPLAINKLKGHIKSALYDFFVELSLPILKSLETIGCTHVFDPGFIEFFQNFLNLHNISEYYLVNLSWVYIMKDSAGDKYTFIVQDENDLRKNFVETYEEFEEAKEIVNLVKNEKYIPYFGINQDPLNIPFTQWRNYVHKSNQLQTKTKTYYWVFIAN